MANHVLSLEVPDTTTGCVLTIWDSSIYMDTAVPQCQQLEITPPGFSRPVLFTPDDGLPTVNFHLNLTGCDLGLQTTNCGTKYCDLPDGIYIIKYSVSPNEIVYVEYNHLRITCALKKVQKILCDIDLGSCDPPFQIKEKLEQIRLIQMYLSAAKAMVEYCHKPVQGMDLYRFSIKLLNKMECGGTCGTSCSSC